MMKSLLVEGTDNVIDLRRYRTFVECKKLLSSYKSRLQNMNKHDIEDETSRIRQEFKLYSKHMLTQAKVQIFEKITQIKVK